MEAISKRSGKKFTGKLAGLMVKIGAASPLKEGGYKAPKAPKAPKKVNPKGNKKKDKK